MTSLRSRRRRRLALLAVLAVMVGACSSDGDEAPASSGDDLSVQVASFDLAVGRVSRFLVGVVTTDQELIGYGSPELRFSFAGTGTGSVPSKPGPPVRAAYLPVPGTALVTPAPAEPRLAKGSERGVYAAETDFDRAGFWQVELTARIDGKERKGTGAFAVSESHVVPAPGDPAIASENLTLSSADAPKAGIDSRAGGGAEVPDPSLHSTTVAAALAAGRPAVVVFSTPVYCQSRFCGPVTDVVEELAGVYGDRASFVHIEIWRDFQGKVINKAAAEWLLRDGDLNEPWVYVVGADGRITARFDNVVNRFELEPLLRYLPVIGPAA